jgi:hypothetical protein
MNSNAFAESFQRFAAFECTEDPLYVALCRAIAADENLLALMRHAPPTQARPNLLLAALHERVLSGDAHGFCDYYPSVGGHRPPDAELPALLRDFAARHEARLIEHLKQRSTQTNETGRCAVLWPALNELAHQTGHDELALFDFGCSAGLNLGVDGYGYDYGTFRLGKADGPQLHARWHGPQPSPNPHPWRITARIGADPAPIDVQDDDAVRWLRACLWPHDRERAARLDAAIALARHEPRRIVRSNDVLATLEDWLDGLPARVQPVLFNSWVLAYFANADFTRHRQRVADLVRRRGLAEISAEVPSLAPAGLKPPPACTVQDPQTPTLWTLQTRTGVQALAWSHGHGKWLEWLA